MHKFIPVLCLSIASVFSHATVTFNTFGPGNTSKAFGWGFGDLRQETRLSAQFTPTVSGALTTLELKLLKSTTAGNVKVSVFKDSGNDLGSVVTTVDIVVSAAGIYTVTNTKPGAHLFAGQKYWIETRAMIGSSVYSGWNTNNQGVSGPIKFGTVTTDGTYGSGGVAELPAFRVNVRPFRNPLLELLRDRASLETTATP